MKVLLADADVSARGRLQAKLEKRGYFVLSVADGQSALAHLLHSEGPWIALIDAELPIVDGLSLCKRVRESAQHHSIYVVLRGNRPSPAKIARGLGAGADDFVSKTCHRSILRARMKLAARTLQTRHAYAEHTKHDPLTALPNRISLIERLERSVLRAKQDPGYQFAVLLINIDRFKVINDSLGHISGNLLMKKIAGRLVRSVRTHYVDSAGDDRRGQLPRRRDIVARLDGDEFAILLEHMSTMEDGITVANRINESFLKGFHLHDEMVPVSASIGIAMSQGAATDASEMLRAASGALDKAKLQGRSRYEEAATHRTSSGAGQLKLENDLRFALERGEFELHYQPIMDLSRTQISRFEALLRWRHPKMGLVPPSIFIPLAEETGFILPLGEAVLRTACRQVQVWNARFHQPTSICINISPRQFVQAGFVDQVTDALRENGLNADSLEVEVTENLALHEVPRAAQVLTELAGRGVSVSLDDFGTRYSSLSHLLRLPIQTLKIDRSFVSEIEHSAQSVSIIQTIISLGHKLGMKITAEGIETEAQLAVLQKLNCDYGQGYLFAPALDSATATEMLFQSRRAVPATPVFAQEPSRTGKLRNGLWAGMPIAEVPSLCA